MTSDGEIGAITKEFDPNMCKWYYLVQVWVEKEPRLMMGKCKILQ